MHIQTLALAACTLAACAAPTNSDGLDVEGQVVSNGAQAVPAAGQVKVVWNAYIGEGEQHGQRFLDGEGQSTEGSFALQLEDAPNDLLLQVDGVAVGRLYLFADAATLPDHLESPEGQPEGWTEPTLDSSLVGIAQDVAIVYVGQDANSETFPDLPQGYSCITFSASEPTEQVSCDDVVIETIEL